MEEEWEVRNTADRKVQGISECGKTKKKKTFNIIYTYVIVVFFVIS